ncbi:FG-GAP-like repeat-containing protein [Streptomyces sp. NPDC052396]|uniref:FG-GAP-like repeat-containing protein n=1 Tax=Streptomyces sp. NPDC052396 TaxID=3365689 RepID=UPI0037D84C12
MDHFGGMKSVGALFGLDEKNRPHYCSASVVQSPGHNLILTAGHCTRRLTKRVAFVPKYNGNNVPAIPYGIWPVKDWFFYPEYVHNDTSNVSDLDFSFASLKSVKGKGVQDVVGGNTLARTKSFYNKVMIVGYPDTGHNPKDMPVKCNTKTWPLPGYNQMQIDCAGMWGGVSGGPWFSKFHDDGTGEIIGNVGGYNGGGILDTKSPMYNRITYSPMHQDYFFRLYDDAQHGRHPNYGKYQQPSVPGYTMGGASTWKHAKLMAAGDFSGRGRGDLIVVWTDGEVTYYSGNGGGGFSEQQQLAPKGSIWQYAEGITAGDFTGSNQFDLLARWSDGEVSLFGDVGSRGLNWETTMVQKKTAQAETWKHATQITAGRFNADKYVTDLMVRWSDGELTLYTNVGTEKKFSEEHKLKDSNKAWEDATLLTAGEYSGNSKWDLLVRWKDGSINSYVGTTVNGLGATHTVHGGNFSTWTHSTVMTTGNFTGNDRTDDLLIRWSDGETSLYEDTTSENLGTEHTLVPSTG